MITHILHHPLIIIGMQLIGKKLVIDLLWQLLLRIAQGQCLQLIEAHLIVLYVPIPVSQIARPRKVDLLLILQKKMLQHRPRMLQLLQQLLPGATSIFGTRKSPGQSRYRRKLFAQQLGNRPL